MGHGWISIVHVLLGQSASVMHPSPAFDPLAHAPVSQIPEPQSESEQHGALLPLHRPVSLTQAPPGHGPALPQPPPAVQFAPGVLPPEHRIGIKSPVRNTWEPSGNVKPAVPPVEQSAVPLAFAKMTLTTHVLVAAPV